MPPSPRVGQRLRVISALAAALAVVGAAGPAAAGPPFLNDDPQPTDRGRWEIYDFAAGARGPGGLGGAAGVDLNYGGAKDLQLTAVLPLAFDNPRGLRFQGLDLGVGDVELAAKLKVVRQSEGGWVPDVAVFPRLYLPTGGRRFGSDHFGLLLPVWAQKDWGPWSVFGGGGYQLNPGAGRRNFWQGGLAVARQIAPRLQIGVEGFAQGDDAVDGGGYRALNLGLTWRTTRHWSLLASGGPTWEHGGGRGEVFYLALKADY